jgi:hypothetical protein
MPLSDTEVYTALIQDTAQISDRRQTMNNIYLSVNSVLLGALAILAQQSIATNVVFLPVEIFIAIVGILIAGQWRSLLQKYKALLGLRFKTLMSIEAKETFGSEFKVYTLEDKTPEVYGYSAIEARLPVIFQLIYVVGSLLLSLATLAAHSGVLGKPS